MPLATTLFSDPLPDGGFKTFDFLVDDKADFIKKVMQR
jgi:hypothetical protein